MNKINQFDYNLTVYTLWFLTALHPFPIENKIPYTDILIDLSFLVMKSLEERKYLVPEEIQLIFLFTIFRNQSFKKLYRFIDDIYKNPYLLPNSVYYLLQYGIDHYKIDITTFKTKKYKKKSNDSKAMWSWISGKDENDTDNFHHAEKMLFTKKQ